MYLRLRQIALVAGKLDPVEQKIIQVFGVPVCYRDPNVGIYGLHNALWALGGTFLEVVAPMQENTTAGRYLERRKGDGGYMVILDCHDMEARRAHFDDMKIRIVQDLKREDAELTAEAFHLHPRDTGGTLLSIDRHSPDSEMKGSYRWAGADWHSKARWDLSICGATLQCDDPDKVALTWSRILKRPIISDRAAGPGLMLDNARLDFVAADDGRGEGLAAVTLKAADPTALARAAEKMDLPVKGASFALGGVWFHTTAG